MKLFDLPQLVALLSRLSLIRNALAVPIGEGHGGAEAIPEQVVAIKGTVGSGLF